MALARIILSSLFAVCTLTVSACSGDPLDGEDADETEPQGSTDNALISTVDCHQRSDTAYVNGVAKPIKLITVGGKPTSIAVGHQFIKMQKAANAAGVTLSINSGFRTMAEQQHLYSCYVNKNCNNGNLAAKPGYSNHQGGFALDLTTSSWLASHAGQYGFTRTVPSEAWHYEYHGPDTGGPCDGAQPDDPGNGGGADDPGNGGGAAPPPPSQSQSVTCSSFTLGKSVPPGTCVQRADDHQWYVCDANAPASWPTVDGPDSPECTSCPQLAGGRCQ